MKKGKRTSMAVRTASSALACVTSPNTPPRGDAPNPRTERRTSVFPSCRRSILTEAHCKGGLDDAASSGENLICKREALQWGCYRREIGCSVYLLSDEQSCVVEILGQRRETERGEISRAPFCCCIVWHHHVFLDVVLLPKE